MDAARYDAVADFYQAGFSDASDPVLLALLELLGPVDGRPVLDVACGQGRLTRELARRGATVTGVDLSRAMIDKAGSPAEIRYLHADIASVPELPDATFDAATCNFGLSDIDNLDAALATVSRVLRRGRPFVFSILHPCFPGGPTVSGAWPSTSSYYDEGYWVADGAESSLRRQVGATHRTLSTYVNTAARHGLLLTAMTEPPPPPAWAATDRREAARFPVFLVARCVKQP